MPTESGHQAKKARGGGKIEPCNVSRYLSKPLMLTFFCCPCSIVHNLSLLLRPLWHSSPLTPPQPHRLPILLHFRNKAIALLDHIRVLLILIIRAVRLNNAVDTIDRTGDPVSGDEFSEIPVCV